jgi:hypothetical protein
MIRIINSWLRPPDASETGMIVEFIESPPAGVIGLLLQFAYIKSI